MEERFAIIVNSLIYILNKFPNQKVDVHKLFKILYFAEKKHLSRYGKTITPDTFHALEYGPVPSDAYNIVKATRTGYQGPDTLGEYSKYFKTTGMYVQPNVDLDLEWLSKSELKCLDESYLENKDLQFKEITDKSHDEAWESGFTIMTNYNIAKAGGASEELLSYILSKDELEKLSF